MAAPTTSKAIRWKNEKENKEIFLLLTLVTPKNHAVLEEGGLSDASEVVYHNIREDGDIGFASTDAEKFVNEIDDLRSEFANFLIGLDDNVIPWDSINDQLTYTPNDMDSLVTNT